MIVEVPMARRDIPIGEALRFGWETVRRNLGLFLVLSVLYVALNGVEEVWQEEDHGSMTGVYGAVGFILSLWVAMGMTKISLRFCDGEKGSFADLLDCLPLLFRYFLGMLLFVVAVAAGLVLLIVPGVYLLLRFFFFELFIVDMGMGPIEALKASSQLTAGVKWQVLAFLAVMVLVFVLGLLCFLVGILVALPTIMVAEAWVYRRLLESADVDLPARGA